LLLLLFIFSLKNVVFIPSQQQKKEKKRRIAKEETQKSCCQEIHIMRYINQKKLGVFSFFLGASFQIRMNEMIIRM